jgi:AmiR/NasT family two-component response regulator
MTPELVFECLIVSEDNQTLSLMSQALERLSIDVKRCAAPAEGLELLSKHNVDLVVCDCKGTADESKLLDRVLKGNRKRKPTILRVAEGTFSGCGTRNSEAHVEILKPLSQESIAQGLKTAYSQMVREERRHARHAIMRRVLGMNTAGKLVAFTISDISERGVGLFSKCKIDAGELLGFDLELTNPTRVIKSEVRVLWMRHNLAGAVFEGMSDADRESLRYWLTHKNKHASQSKQHARLQ